MLPPDNLNEPLIDKSATDTQPSVSSDNKSSSTNKNTIFAANNSLPKHYLITSENFDLLKRYQREISELTDFTPSFRKLVNCLITIENLEKAKTLLINTFKS